MVKKYRIILAQDDEDYPPYFRYAERGEKGIVVGRKPDASDMAAVCDQDAENCNFHDFCGVHTKLLRLMVAADVDSALATMKKISERGGLHHL